MITPALLSALAPSTRPAIVAPFAPALETACTRFGVDTPSRKAMFLAQVAHECAGFSMLSESLNYAAEKLVPKFGARRISEVDAQRLGRRDGQPADPAGIANIVYGGEWGRLHLGNTQPGDGWLYRGRGLIQLTGRSAYQRAGQALGLDLIGNPDLLLTPGPAALSAGWFWDWKDCNGPADAGQISECTRRINGGQNGIDDRRALWVLACKLLGV
ncbi:glycoside hydrolase family 19 protein [Niveispirillum cyanobacteriorum]|uniref:Endolysin n=1 Tax=Niveispirillum cyanobacteriorum TaxID=1612173 RepID=A0A2K9NI96_9PROT|nr:glycoside hydrolase family 19 protein [Niveispirillum cyanobacteriorum]AUN32812.1 endolysin [Niveispirillum cyanobacteriorum]